KCDSRRAYTIRRSLSRSGAVQPSRITRPTRHTSRSRIGIQSGCRNANAGWIVGHTNLAEPSGRGLGETDPRYFIIGAERNPKTLRVPCAPTVITTGAPHASSSAFSRPAQHLRAAANSRSPTLHGTAAVQCTSLRCRCSSWCTPRMSSRPPAPTNGRPFASSVCPGTSPTIASRARPIAGSGGTIGASRPGQLAQSAPGSLGRGDMRVCGAAVSQVTRGGFPYAAWLTTADAPQAARLLRGAGRLASAAALPLPLAISSAISGVQYSATFANTRDLSWFGRFYV